jgi:hypothetical protein
MPKEEREAIEQPQEICEFMDQSNISKKNISRLKDLTQSENVKIAEMAAVVLKVAAVKPHKRKRMRILAREHRDLLHELERVGLIWDYSDVDTLASDEAPPSVDHETESRLKS